MRRKRRNKAIIMKKHKLKNLNEKLNNNECAILHIGGGMVVLDKAINMDNSYSVKLASNNLLYATVARLGLLSEESLKYIDFCKNNNIVYGNCKKMPFLDDTFDLIYSSHMCEHLCYEDLRSFLGEVYRCLKKRRNSARSYTGFGKNGGWVCREQRCRPIYDKLMFDGQ